MPSIRKEVSIEDLEELDWNERTIRVFLDVFDELVADGLIDKWDYFDEVPNIDKILEDFEEMSGDDLYHYTLDYDRDYLDKFMADAVWKVKDNLYLVWIAY